MNARSNAPIGQPAVSTVTWASEAVTSTLALVSLKLGDRVHIFQIKAFHRPFIEGRAIIIAPILDTTGIYYVKFEGETVLRRWNVLPGIFQDDPEQALEVLQTAWRASVLMEDLAPILAGGAPANDNREG